MNSKEILDWFEDCFRPSDITGRDHSIQSRVSLIPADVQHYFRPQFLRSMFGCATTPPDELQCVVFAAFLSEQTADSAIRECSGNGHSLFVVHHLFDMNCGDPGKLNGKPFSFIRAEQFVELFQSGVTLFASHLPYDEVFCRFNTSLRLAKRISDAPVVPLYLTQLNNIGYEVRLKTDLRDTLEKLFSSVVSYGAPLAKGREQKVAVIAGVVSSPQILWELEQNNYDVLVCGDVYVRVPGSRYSAMVKCVQETSLSILCISHLKSEQIALMDTAEGLKTSFPKLKVKFIREDLVWK